MTKRKANPLDTVEFTSEVPPAPGAEAAPRPTPPPLPPVPEPAFFPTINVRGCERCGADHDHLPMRLLARPMVHENIVIATHWTLCPARDEPILLVMGG